MSKKMKTMDGNTAAAYISYAMAEHVVEMAAHGQKNLFGQ